ncbi:MAG: LysR family transcriptional regulator [Proteobacteria bacterium]|nr:LysR family transcriptional regulator [Pseudomonadota bacterium]
MTLEQLRIFVCVADRLNMTRAAEALHITQSGVSASISALEQAYGTVLFDRVGRRIELSAAGEAFLVEAEKVLRQVSCAQRTLQDLSNLRRGKVVLCASQTVGNYYLPAVIARFQERWPSLDTELSITNTAGAVRMILEGAAEIGVVEGEHSEPVLTNLRIPGDRICVVVAPSHAWARRAPDLAELAKVGWVLREEGSGTRSEFMRALDGLGVDPRDIDIRLELPTNEAVRSAVAAGAGPGVLSELAVAESVAAGLLVKVEVELPRRAFFILRHSERKLSRAADVFMKTLAGQPAVCEKSAMRLPGRTFDLVRATA